jgi:hypothetical protein
VTLRDHVIPNSESLPMPTISLDGTAYFTAAEVLRIARVARGTLWRWRRAGKVEAIVEKRGETIAVSAIV